MVENKPGAGSSIAAQYVVRAAADGYTLFVPALSSLTYQIVNPDVSFDLRKDFAPIAPLAKGTFVLAVNPELKVNSVAELIALAKAKPGQLLFGSVGNGSLPHLCAEMFAQRTGCLLYTSWTGKRSRWSVTSTRPGRSRTQQRQSVLRRRTAVPAGSVRRPASTGSRSPERRNSRSAGRCRGASSAMAGR